jgi:hypothetical protein
MKIDVRRSNNITSNSIINPIGPDYETLIGSLIYYVLNYGNNNSYGIDIGDPAVIIFLDPFYAQLKITLRESIFAQCVVIYEKYLR